MDTREDETYCVTQYIIDGVRILDATEFLVPYIPIVPVWGRQMMVKGRRNNYSLVRYAKDPQRLVNLYVSNIAEQIALMPKTTYKATPKQIAGFEDDWEKINENPNTVTLYNPESIGGELVGAPEREVNEPPIQALTIGLNQAIDGIKAAMGIFDASLGSGPGDTAGIAIEKRQKESDVANFHVADNEARSRKYAGEIILALTRVLDKGKKTLPTRTEDGKTELVAFGQPTKDKKTGADVCHDLTSGDYQVSISSGPSYTSQREQANVAYGQIAAADKNFMTIAGDLYFRTSDMPGADQIADRYEKMLPPQLQPQATTDGASMARQLQALTAQHSQLMALVHAQAQVIETKQIEAQSRERIAERAEATKLALGEMAAKTQTLARAQADRLAMLDAAGAIADRAHEAGMAAQGAEADQASQDSAQGHQVGQQASAQDAAARAAELAAQNQPQSAA